MVFASCKQELGWTDYRFTHFKDIERWWKIIFCVYTMISLNSQAFLSLNQYDKFKLRYKKVTGVIFLIIKNGSREMAGRIL